MNEMEYCETMLILISMKVCNEKVCVTVDGRVNVLPTQQTLHLLHTTVRIARTTDVTLLQAVKIIPKFCKPKEQ